VKDDLLLALGEGRVNYQAIFKALINRGYNSTVTTEVKIKDMLRTKQTLEDFIKTQ